MANNANINKVIYGNDTLIDLTGDTVTQADVLNSKSFHDASGTLRTGTADISGKADKVSGATNGDLAGLDSNGNLTDSGIASTNVVVKSSTTGLLKNDGTVDTSTYLTSVPRGTTSVVGGYTYEDDFFFINNQVNNTLSLKFGSLTHGAICPPSAGDVADALADKISWDDNTILGAHNLNASVYYPATSNGVTWSYIDGVFDAYSETGATANSTRGTSFVATITAQVILSGCNSGDTGIHIYPYDVTDNARPYTNSAKTTRLTTNDNVYNGNEVSFYMEKGHSYTMTCRVQTGETPNHVKFYPLLRLASDSDDTYSPYTMTNSELTNSVTFVATYGVTTYSEIHNAFNTGRFIVVNREIADTSQFTYYLRRKDTSGTYYFQTFGNSNTTNYYCTIASSGTWAVGSTYLAPLASPAFTGTPTAPTATAGTNTTQIATTAFVKTAIDDAITSALSASY